MVVTTAIAPNSINLVLDTRIEPRKNLSNVLHHDRVKDKVKYALIPINNDQYRKAIETEPRKYFTNFLYDIVHDIIKLDPMGVKPFFENLYYETKYYFRYKGSALVDIIKNPLVRRYLENTLQEWSETNPYDMKTKIKDYLEIVRNKNTLNKLGEFLNNFYDQKDEVIMKKFVNKLKRCLYYLDVGTVIRTAVYSIVIKQYDKFNYTVRTKISDEVNRLAELAIQRRSQGDDNLNTTIKVMAPNIKLGKTSYVNDNKNNKQTKMDTSTVLEPEHKDIKEIIISDSEKPNDNDNLSQIIDTNKPTASLETKSVTLPYPTQITQNVIENTSQVLKRFKLEHAKENVAGNEKDTTTVIQNITKSIIRPVPYDIINGNENIIVLKAVENRINNTTQVPQNITTTSSLISVPKYVEVVPQFIKNDYTSNFRQNISSANLKINKQAAEYIAKISKNGNVLKVSERVKRSVPILSPHNSSTIRELRVYDEINRPELVREITPEVPRKTNVSKVIRKIKPNVPQKINTPKIMGKIKPNVPRTIIRPKVIGKIKPKVPWKTNGSKIIGKIQPKVPRKILRPKFMRIIRPKVARNIRKGRKKIELRKGKKVSNKTTSFIPPGVNKWFVQQAYIEAHAIDKGNLRHDIDTNKTTKSTRNTSRVLKRFKLRHPKENTNNITPPVPYNTTNGTENIIITKAVEDGTNDTINVLQNITKISSVTFVPKYIKNGPVIDVNTKSVYATPRPLDFPAYAFSAASAAAAAFTGFKLIHPKENVAERRQGFNY